MIYPTFMTQAPSPAERIFEMMRTEMNHGLGEYLTELMRAELSHYLGREPYERKEGDALEKKPIGKAAYHLPIFQRVPLAEFTQNA